MKVEAMLTGVGAPLLAVAVRSWSARDAREICGRRRDPALPLHLAQLVLDAAWSPLFFSARPRRSALGVVVAVCHRTDRCRLRSGRGRVRGRQPVGAGDRW